MATENKRAFIHRVNPGERGSRADLCYRDSELLTGYSRIRDARKFAKRTDLRDAIFEHYPENGLQAAGNRAGYFWIFLHEMQIGDLVVTPERQGGRTGLHVCRIQGEPYYRDDQSSWQSDTCYRREVEWLTTYDSPLDPTSGSEQLEYAIMKGSRMTTRTAHNLHEDILALLDAAGIDHEQDPALESLAARQFPPTVHEQERTATLDAARQNARKHANALMLDVEADDALAHEGTPVQYALHRSHERDRKIVAAKKAQVLARTGRLACECCDYDFKHAWDVPGGPYVEAHHLVHLSKGERTTRLMDLALLCATCHRAIHRLPSGTRVAELRARLREPSK